MDAVSELNAKKNAGAISVDDLTNNIADDNNNINHNAIDGSAIDSNAIDNSDDHADDNAINIEVVNFDDRNLRGSYFDTDESSEDRAKKGCNVRSNKNNSYATYSNLARTTNQLKSLQELADFFFCYSWMFERTARIVYWQNMALTIVSMSLSVLSANSQFLAFNCSEETWITTITGSILYLVAFLIAINHFLELPSLYKEYKGWAAICLDNYYELQHWMIDAAHCKETYIQFSRRMTRDYVTMTKKSRPVSGWAKRGLIREFRKTNIRFPPMVGHVEGRNVQAVDLDNIIVEVTKSLQQKERQKALQRKIIHDMQSGHPTVQRSTQPIHPISRSSNPRPQNQPNQQQSVQPLHMQRSANLPSRRQMFNDDNLDVTNEMIVIDVSENTSLTDQDDLSSQDDEFEAPDPRIAYELGRLNNRIIQ